MQNLHQPANDLLNTSFDQSPLYHPLSLHHTLSYSTDPFTPSTPYPPSQGVLVSVGVEPLSHSQPHTVAASSSVADGAQPLTFRHLNTKTWAARNHHKILSETRLLEWYGVELGNMHLSSGISRMRREREPHAQWFTQTYLVKSAGVEKVLDHSFFMRMPFESTRKHEADAVPASSSLPTNTTTATHSSSPSTINSNSTTSCLTLQSAITANLIPSTPVTPLSPDLVGPKSNLLAGSVQLGYEHWRGLNVMLFGASDGLVAGGSIFKKFKHNKVLTQLPATSTASSKSPLTSLRSFLPFRLLMEDTSLGAEYAWAQELKDYTAAFGFQSRFRIGSKAEGEAAATKPMYLAPLCSFATSMQFYGHIVSTFHASLTPRLTFATRFHAQLVNQESRLDVAWAYRLNPRHRIMTAFDSTGGVRVGVEWKASHQQNANLNAAANLNTNIPTASATPSATHSTVSSALSRFLSHITCRVFVQSYPLLPALLPSWNLAGSDVNGATYDPIQLKRLTQSQFSFGLSVEYEGD